MSAPPSDDFRLAYGPVELTISHGGLLEAPESAVACPIDLTFDCSQGRAAALNEQFGGTLYGRLRAAFGRGQPPAGAVTSVPNPEGGERTLLFVLTSAAPERAPRSERRAAMRALLEHAHRNRLADLAVPALGRPSDAATAAMLADDMLEALIRFVGSNGRSTFLRRLRVVIEDRQHFSVFCQRARGLLLSAHAGGKLPDAEPARPGLDDRRPATRAPSVSGGPMSTERLALVSLSPEKLTELIARGLPGVEVLPLTALEQAKRAFKGSPPDLVLLDDECLHLGDHLEVFARLREWAGHDVGTILMIDSHRTEAMLEAVEKSVDAVLAKPPHLGAIRQAVAATREKLALRESRRTIIEGLENLSKMQDEFLHMVSHDLMNPLTVALNTAEMLGEELPEKGKAQALARLLQSSLERIASLARDLTDLSAMQTGKLKITLAPADPAALLERVGQAFSVLAGKKGVDFKRGFPASLPAIELDTDRLQQVLMNLLGNSLKHTEPGRSILLAGTADAGEVVVLVSDTGAGIAAADLPRIFEPFYQAAAAANERTGLGLGLAICRGIISGHRGSIKASSEGLGKGTTIELRFPVVAAPPASKT